MRNTCAAFCTILLAVTALAQSDRGTLTGRLSDPDNGPIAAAFVQLKNTSTGTIYQATSKPDGTYSVTGLPAGTYDLTIPTNGFTFRRLQQNGIEIKAGATVRRDIRFDWAGNLGTPGDDDSLAVRSRSVLPTGATPRTPDGKPDLSGMWVGLATSPEAPAVLPWADKIMKERQANGGAEHPSGFCLPGDVILQSAFIYKTVQAPGLLLILWDDNLPGVQQIFLDGRPHPKEFFPSWMGHSVGHWEGDTLVVDTVGFNDQSWLGLTPHTDQLHVVQRYRRPDLAHLVKDVTIEDPGTFTKPWNYRVTWELARGEEIQEMVCDSNHYPAHLAPK